MWNPATYHQYGKERSRPFHDLIGRVGAADPQRVADLGCGSGELTAELSRRWPGADVVGVDSSAEMIAAAGIVLAGQPGLRLRFDLRDARDWEPDDAMDVIVSNALLQWIPDHDRLVVRWARNLADGGWLAFQLPANFDQPGHVLMRELAGSPRWRAQLGDVVLNRQAQDPAAYLDLLERHGCEVDAWQTTYLHVLSGDDPVLNWYKGTGLRPVMAALDPEPTDEFMAEYARLLAKAYPQESYGTVLPFRRIFVVARRR